MTSKTKWEEVTRLNEMVKIRLAPSKIHGVGVFAIRDIKKGEKAYVDFMPTVFTLRYADFGKLNKEVKELILEKWPRVITGDSYFAFPDVCFSAYMNHASNPNFDAKNDIALCEIKKGEELTEDYSLIPGWEKAFPWLAKEKSMV